MKCTIVHSGNSRVCKPLVDGSYHKRINCNEHSVYSIKIATWSILNLKCLKYNKIEKRITKMEKLITESKIEHHVKSYYNIDIINNIDYNTLYRAKYLCATGKL